MTFNFINRFFRNNILVPLPTGTLVRAIMINNSIPKRSMAFALDLTINELNQLLRNELIMTEELASRLTRELGYTTDFWINSAQQDDEFYYG